jgi:hypothetical protein
MDRVNRGGYRYCFSEEGTATDAASFSLYVASSADVSPGEIWLDYDVEFSSPANKRPDAGSLPAFGTFSLSRITLKDGTEAGYDTVNELIFGGPDPVWGYGLGMKNGNDPGLPVDDISFKMVGLIPHSRVGFTYIRTFVAANGVFEVDLTSPGSYNIHKDHQSARTVTFMGDKATQVVYIWSVVHDVDGDGNVTVKFSVDGGLGDALSDHYFNSLTIEWSADYPSNFVKRRGGKTLAKRPPQDVGTKDDLAVILGRLLNLAGQGPGLCPPVESPIVPELPRNGTENLYRFSAHPGILLGNPSASFRPGDNMSWGS